MGQTDACCDPCADQATPVHLLMTDCGGGGGGGFLSGIVMKITATVCVASVVYVQVAAALAAAVPVLITIGWTLVCAVLFAAIQLAFHGLVRLDRRTVQSDRTTFEQWQALQDRPSALPSGLEPQHLGSGVAGLLGPGEPQIAVPRPRHLEAVPSQS